MINDEFWGFIQFKFIKEFDIVFDFVGILWQKGNDLVGFKFWNS